MKQFTKIAAATALLAGSLISTGAMAETVTSTIDATAGLQPALELTCTPVKFGVWRVPVRSGSVTTEITLTTTTDSPTVAGEQNRVAQSFTAGWEPTRGKCTLSGTPAATDALVDVTMTDFTNMPLGGAADSLSKYVGLNAPGTALTLMKASLVTVATATVTSTGTATFYIGGTLTIPAVIVKANYGGYKTTSAAGMSVDDKM